MTTATSKASSSRSGGVTYEIYPSIGVARVGNAPEEYYIGPEAYRALPTLPGGPARPFEPRDFRDGAGRLRRQAACFHLFKRDASGTATEITLDDPEIAEIRWTVHLANKKASWYEFQTTRGETGYAPNHPLRNANVEATAERQKLIIDPGPRSIAGRDRGGVEFSRGTVPPGYEGSFPPPDLEPYAIDTIGSLKTDAAGRLLVLGGHGRSGSTARPPALPTYANNDGWWDDTSDGPVTATVVLRSGETIEAVSAWVLVAPPKFAPQLANLVTLYDTIFDIAVRYQGLRPDIFEDGMWKRGAGGYKPSFETDILPIFQRGMDFPWVAAIPPKAHTFDLGKLGDPRADLNGFRRYYMDALRAPGDENVIVAGKTGVTMMPYLAGDDALGAETVTTSGKATSKYLRLTDTQYFFLQQWAEGHFEPGARPEPDPGRRITRGVLENCVGGAFSPGIEMTWISRNPAVYAEPFRLKRRRALPDPLSLDFDPARGLEPGDVTRYMALPWQADFNECSSQPIEGRVLWWWPAQRPEFVYLSEKAQPRARQGLGGAPAPKRQVPWVGTDYDQNAPNYISFADNVEMVEKWWQLGFVFDVGTPEKPEFVEVERVLGRT